MFQSKPRHSSRIEQIRQGDKALEDGNLATALKYYNIAILPRSHDSILPVDILLIEAKEKLEALKNRIAEQEMQKVAVCNSHLIGSKTV